MINSFRPTFAEIHLQNIDFNMATVMKVAGQNRFVCPMIKANAYGHGAIPVAQQILKNYKLPLGVVLVEEALELRAAGIHSEILVFGGFDQNGAKQIIDAHLTPVISQFEQFEFLNQMITAPLNLHVKFNTGMNRLGFNPEETERVISFLKAHPKMKVQGILSHLHSAPRAEPQASLLMEVLEQFKDFGVQAHLLNSDAIAHLSQLQKDPSHHILKQYQWGFRPGLMLYGYHAKTIRSDLKLKPAMTLKSTISDLRRIKKGETVSYNATWTSEKDSMIAIIPIGYADGVHRLLSNRGHVFVQGQKAPMIGQVCMDFLMIDVSHIESSHLKNAEVIFFDDRFQGADTLASAAETISYEIMTSVSSRVPRRYIDHRWGAQV